MKTIEKIVGWTMIGGIIIMGIGILDGIGSSLEGVTENISLSVPVGFFIVIIGAFICFIIPTKHDVNVEAHEWRYI